MLSKSLSLSTTEPYRTNSLACHICTPYLIKITGFTQAMVAMPARTLDEYFASKDVYILCTRSGNTVEKMDRRSVRDAYTEDAKFV
jgi:hypothetical protein